ncbi:BTB/POZ domain-containing protein 6-like [Palaemon carinicauda]|uniref:BTB/POZ domain-containing protein 6-like n=1 Tax=Palaemon carinicauda TaxID=392227 RepID=UPI0035B62A17
MSGHSGSSLNPMMSENPQLPTVPELVRRFSASKMSDPPTDPPGPTMSSEISVPSTKSHHRPWQDSLHTVSKALGFLLASGIHSDVTFVVGREGKQFKIFTDNGNAVLISSSLLDLTPEAMTQLLQEPLRVTSETVILKALVSWGQAQLKLEGKQLTPSNLRQLIKPFLSEIRFLTMTSDEFVQNVVTADILSPEETVYVLKNIAKPGETAPLHNVNDIPINTSRVNRSSLITKEQMRSCLCEGVNKTWLRDTEYEFQFVVSDNIVLMAIKVQLGGGEEDIQLDIRKEDPRAKPLASVETVGNNLAFKNPVHLREGITYVFTLKLKDSQTSLFGCRYSKQSYEADGFIITLSSGVFIQAVVFT